MYYGGDPVQWTDSPSIPHDARYEVMNKPIPPPTQPPPVPAAAAAAGGGGGGAAPAAARQYAVAGSRVVNKHPLSEVWWGWGGWVEEVRWHVEKGRHCSAVPHLGGPLPCSPGTAFQAHLPCLCPCLAPQVGGYQLHHVQGAVGGAKGVGLSSGRAGGTGAAGAGAAAGADPKRKRDGGNGEAGGQKQLSKEEREFLARREAARQRVQQRTAATFGLG